MRERANQQTQSPPLTRHSPTALLSPTHTVLLTVLEEIAVKDHLTKLAEEDGL